MAKMIIIEGNSNDKDNVRAYMVKGERGFGIKSLEKILSDVLVDTYKITFDDGRTQNFTVTNGKGIVSIEKTSTDGLVDTYTITYNDNTTETFTVTNAMSPLITTKKENGVATITLTDVNGTHTFKLSDGEMSRAMSTSIYNTVAVMKADTTISAGIHCKTLGYYNIDDGGGAEYQIVDDNTLVANNGDIIELDNGLKAKMIISSSVNVKQFGAKGDEVADDTFAINTALANCNNVYIPDGHYMINTLGNCYDLDLNKGIRINNNQNLTISDGATLELIDGNTDDTPTMILFNNVSHCTLKGGTFIGDKDTHVSQHWDSGIIRTINSHYITIEDCNISNGWADCICIGDNASDVTKNDTNIIIKNCHLYNSRRQGISLTSCNDITISNCYIHNISGGAPQSCIDIECSFSNNPITNILIENCTFDNSSKNGLIITKYSKNILINNCTFLNGFNQLLNYDITTEFNNCTFYSGLDVHTQKFNNCKFLSTTFFTYGTDDTVHPICNNCRFENTEIGIGLGGNENVTHIIELNDCFIYTDSNYANNRAYVFLARKNLEIIIDNCYIESFQRLTSTAGKKIVCKNSYIEITKNVMAPLFRTADFIFINNLVKGSVETVFIVFESNNKSFICNNTFYNNPGKVLATESTTNLSNNIFVCNNVSSNPLNIGILTYLPNVFTNNNYA